MHPVVSSEFISVNGAVTHILKVGQLATTIDQHIRVLFIVIPGNPGIMDYYEEFMKELHQHSGYKYPVWGISHAGHVTISQDNTSLTDGGPYGVQDQIDHKVEFIKNNVPNDVQLVLIGHSIGCYIILHMLRKLESHQILRCFMLFPTIERMALSPHGKIATPMLKWLRWLGIFIVTALSYLSHHVQYRLILWYFSSQDVPSCAYNASMNLFNPSVIDNVTFMADQEMKRVSELEPELVKNNLSKLSFYYGLTDHWCPLEYYFTMKKKFPHGDIRLCEKGISHSFVLEAQSGMASILWDWLQPDLHKLTD